MRVAAIQFKARRGHKREALERLRGLAAQAAPGSDLVVLPEMAATGYLFASPGSARAIAETPEGPLFATLAPLAAAHGAWIVAGFAEDAGEALYNSALVIDRTGALAGVYRKTLLFQPDYWWARPGDTGYLAFDTGAGRFGVGICMDLNDDAFIAWLRGAGLDAIAFPTNWVEEDIDVWAYWKERLAGIDAALVAANTYGTEGPVAFTGLSAVIQGGQVLASAPPTGDRVLHAVLSGGEG